MPRVPRRERLRLDVLTFYQRQQLCSGLFPDAFASPADERRAWEEHRPELISDERRVREGTRPLAFWRYDVRIPELVDDDPDEPIDWREWSAGDAFREHALGHVSGETLAVLARAHRLFTRRVQYLRARHLLAPGEDPERAGPHWQLVAATPALRRAHQ